MRAVSLLRGQRFLHAFAAGLVVWAAAAPAPSWSRALPEPSLRVHLAAQDTPIALFLQQLAAPAKLSATVSPKITGAVSGVFDGPLEAILTRVGRAFGAAYYYDGKTLEFYPAAERANKTFDLAPGEAARVQSQASRQGLIDSQDTLRAEGERLIAAGAPLFVAEIEALVDHPAPRPRVARPLDETASEPARAPTGDPVEYRVYYLHYGWAADTRIDAGDRQVMIPGVATILRALVQGLDDRRDADASIKVVSKPAAQPGLAGSGLATSGQTSADSASGRTTPTTLAGLFGLATKAAAPAAPPKPAAQRSEPEPKPELPPSQFRVEADPRLNAVIVRDTRAQLDLYGPLIEALDVEPTLVQIEATIIDVDLERAKQAGFNLAFSGPNGSSFASSLDGVLPNFPQPGGMSISAVIGDKNQFVAKLEALESEGVARIVSRPLVMTLSDVEATFQDDQTFYVPVNGSLSTDLYNVTAGTDLRVTPHVIHDKAQDRIRLIVEIDDGSLSTQLVGAIPVVQKASLNTEALILSGQSLLVGGMVSQNDTDYHAKIPGVSAVPVLGQLFRASRKAATHTERLFLITPRLAAVGNPAVAPAGTRELSQTSLSPAAPGEAKQ